MDEHQYAVSLQEKGDQEEPFRGPPPPENSVTWPPEWTDFELALHDLTACCETEERRFDAVLDLFPTIRNGGVDPAAWDPREALRRLDHLSDGLVEQAQAAERFRAAAEALVEAADSMEMTLGMRMVWVWAVTIPSEMLMASARGLRGYQEAVGAWRNSVWRVVHGEPEDMGTPPRELEDEEGEGEWVDFLDREGIQDGSCDEGD